MGKSVQALILKEHAFYGSPKASLVMGLLCCFIFDGPFVSLECMCFMGLESLASWITLEILKNMDGRSIVEEASFGLLHSATWALGWAQVFTSSKPSWRLCTFHCSCCGIATPFLAQCYVDMPCDSSRC